MIGTLLVISKEKEQQYGDFMQDVACTVYRESVKGVKSMRENHTHEEVIKNNKVIGMATGQVLLDEVIEKTKDFSREELIQYLAESSAQSMIMSMNKHPEYKMKIQMLTTFGMK